MIFILSPAGRDILMDLAAEPITPDTLLPTAERLRARLEPGMASAVLETALLRRQGVRKFSRAADMYFTRDGLEQATAEPVAAYRTLRYTAAGLSLVADLGCGIGGDTLALAAAGATVVAVDLKWAHVAMTQANAAACELSDQVLPAQADLLQLPPMPVAAFFFDPARRTTTGPHLAPGRRLRSVDDYQPPLSFIETWRPLVPDGAVKVSPGINYAEVPVDAELEFVSLAAEVKEGVLWFGGLRTAARRRATLLPGGHTLTDLDDSETTCGPPRTYLYEPDGAVIRAHLVRQLAHRLDATMIDPEIAYLSGDTAISTPFARCFRLDDYFPFQLKRLRQYLRERDVGTVTIKKRGSPLDPDVLRQALRLRGMSHRIVFLTQVLGRPTVLVGESVA